MAPKPLEDEERTPFLRRTTSSQSESLFAQPTASRNENSSIPSDDNWTLTNSKRRLYVSHFLSTCNSRVFEFGSVLYLAAIFPGTLLPMSVYAMARGASAILLSSLVGQYIDRGNRLKVVRLSIGMYLDMKRPSFSSNMNSVPASCGRTLMRHLLSSHQDAGCSTISTSRPSSCSCLDGVH